MAKWRLPAELLLWITHLSQPLHARLMTAGELAEHFDMTKPSMSHHFAVLKQADLIEARRKGQQIYYALNTTVVEDFLAIVWDPFSNRRPEGSKP